MTFVLLVADVMISKPSGAHQMFPGSMPTVTLTVKCGWGFALFWCLERSPDDAAEGRAVELDGRGLGVWAPVRPLEARQVVQEHNSTLSSVRCQTWNSQLGILI
jgi:hypothetical protein